MFGPLTVQFFKKLNSDNEYGQRVDHFEDIPYFLDSVDSDSSFGY